MKNFKFLSVLFFVFLFTFSCKEYEENLADGYLKERFYGNIPDNLLWNDKIDAEKTINAIVRYMDTPFGYYNISFILMEDGATDYFQGGSEFLNFNNFSSNYPTSFNWAVFPPMWGAIFYSNLVLNRLDRIPNLTTAEKNKFRGQGLFFRAFNYYFAQSMFGGVPIIETPDETRTSIPQGTRDQVRELIEKDLIEAATLLPSHTQAKADAQLSRPSKQAAYGLLARLYLNWKSDDPTHWTNTNPTLRWQKVIDACDQVINNPDGLALLGENDPTFDYSRIFALDNEKNAEMVYVIQHSIASFDSGYFSINNNILSPRDMLNPIGTQSRWLGDWTVQPDFYNDNQDSSYNPRATDGFTDDVLELQDKRRKQLLISYKDKNGNTINIKDVKELGWRGALVNKYPLDPFNINNPIGGNDQPIIRFADILLMKAEALNEINNISEARIYLNRVRKRAGLTDLNPTTKNNCRTFIYRERRKEFFFEGLGRTDMIRMTNSLGKNRFLLWIGYLLSSTNPKSTTTEASSKYLLYPFDTQSLTQNPGLKQNPDYN